MSEMSSGTSEKLSGHSEKSLAEAMKAAIVLLAGPRRWSDTKQSWLARAAKRAGITCRQAKSLFYMETQNPCGQLVFKVQRAAQAFDSAAEGDSRALYKELIETKQRLERLIARTKDEGAACEDRTLVSLVSGELDRGADQQVDRAVVERRRRTAG